MRSLLHCARPVSCNVVAYASARMDSYATRSHSRESATVLLIRARRRARHRARARACDVGEWVSRLFPYGFPDGLRVASLCFDCFDFASLCSTWNNFTCTLVHFYVASELHLIGVARSGSMDTSNEDVL